jgi:hypothetical protein
LVLFTLTGTAQLENMGLGEFPFLAFLIVAHICHKEVSFFSFF